MATVPVASHAASISVPTGTPVTLEVLQNGTAQYSPFSGTVGNGVDIDIFGCDLDLNTGANSTGFAFVSNGDYCGWACGGETIEIKVTGLNFGSAFGISDFSTIFTNAMIAINSATSFSLIWKNDGSGSSSFQNGIFASGTFIDANVAPVPLPAAGLLLLGSVGGLAAIRKRRKAT